MNNDAPVEVLQDRKELYRLLVEVEKVHPKKILEIGSMYGGSLWYWLQLLEKPAARATVKRKSKRIPPAKRIEQNPPMVVSVDLPVGVADSRYEAVMYARSQWSRWAEETGVGLIALEEDSTSMQTVEKVDALGPYEFVFIDGGHDYATVNSDFLNYYPMVRPGGLLAVHDVNVPPANDWRIETGMWWQDLVSAGLYNTSLISSSPDGWGVGLVWKSVDRQAEQHE